jgi:AAA+ ATPase superfamily predicted ATPase
MDPLFVRRFVDRERELDALHQRLAQNASLSLVFGQRRAGKTYLLQQLFHGRPEALYFLADESTAGASLRRFHAEVSAAGLGGPMWDAVVPVDWGTSLTLLFQSALGSPDGLTLVLDELPYLVEAEPALPSILQRLWDTFRDRGRLHILLCGSALGTMASLGEEGQPLHGRFDLRLRLRPFPYHQVARFVPGWSPRDTLMAYGVFGGLARHDAELRPQAPLDATICRAILDPLGPLHDAPLDLLRTEHLSSHGDASSVLAAVAGGENRFSAIAAATGLSSDRVAYVADELIAIDVLVRERRFGDRPGSRYTRYRCADPFTTFWFRHVFRNRSALHSAGPDRVWTERIAPRMDDHCGHVFEAVVAQALEGGLVEALPGPIDEMAPWWSRDGQTEIDLVVRSGDDITYLECKWRSNGQVDLHDLHRFREHLSRYPGYRSGHRLAMATAGAFSEPLGRVAEAEGIVLIGTEQLLPG